MTSGFGCLLISMISKSNTIEQVQSSSGFKHNVPSVMLREQASGTHGSAVSECLAVLEIPYDAYHYIRK
eukprot:174453-Amphidinium_carterae.1